MGGIGNLPPGPPANSGVVVTPPGAGSAPPQPSDNLFIAGLPLGFTEEQVREVFGQYGGVSSCKVLPNNGKPDCAAMVRMVDLHMAAWLVQNLSGNIPVGLAGPITVRFANSKGGGDGGSYGKAPSGDGGNRFSPYGETAPAPPPTALEQQMAQAEQEMNVALSMATAPSSEFGANWEQQAAALLTGSTGLMAA